MSKRLNYYQVHHNKKPRKKKGKRVNLLALKLQLIQMQGFVQQSIIVSQSFKSIAEKSLAVVENVINIAEAISNEVKKEKNIQYLIKKSH